MTLFAPGPPVIMGVDTVLRTIAEQAVRTLPDTVAVTVGPLDRPVSSPRLNWFLYRITPALAYANMESPRSGWTTRRGRPPLALVLHYLLSAEPGELTESGDDESAVHAGLSAVMNALHENGIFGLDSLVATAPDRRVHDVTSALDGLIEPLRITLADVAMESVTAMWTTGSRAMRLSVGYEISLLTVPVEVPYASGPPVLERVVGVGPANVPSIATVVPALLWSGSSSTVMASGLTDDVTVTLSRLPGDPDDPTDGRPDPTLPSSGPWQLTVVRVDGGLRVSLPGPGVVAGARELTLTNTLAGIPAGTVSTGLTVVPMVEPPVAALPAGTSVALRAAHVAGAGQVFFAGLAATFTVTAPATLTTAAQIAVTVPTAVTGPVVAVSLQVGAVTGPPRDLAVAP